MLSACLAVVLLAGAVVALFVPPRSTRRVGTLIIRDAKLPDGFVPPSASIAVPRNDERSAGGSADRS